MKMSAARLWQLLDRVKIVATEDWADIPAKVDWEWPADIWASLCDYESECGLGPFDVHRYLGEDLGQDLAVVQRQGTGTEEDYFLITAPAGALKEFDIDELITAVATWSDNWCDAEGVLENYVVNPRQAAEKLDDED